MRFPRFCVYDLSEMMVADLEPQGKTACRFGVWRSARQTEHDEQCAIELLGRPGIDLADDASNPIMP